MTVPTIKARHPLIVKTMLWHDEASTESFAQFLARQPSIGRAMIELQGQLGAGKTTFVRHLLKGLGVQGRIKSPTYAVVETYTLNTSMALQGDNLPLTIWHFDFYRFNDPSEWEDAGFRDIFASLGLKLIEWPEKAGAYLPLSDLVIHIDALSEESRFITLTAYTPTGTELIP